uniref:Uncharacterized protein n=1 Tax=Anguilla anguilla TaxID=7936 RepID=A0A0E9XVA9_ANGAN
MFYTLKSKLLPYIFISVYSNF